MADLLHLFIFVALICNNYTFDFFVKTIELCNLNVHYPIKMYASLRKHGKNQIVDGNATFSVPFDDSIMFNLTCEILVGNQFVHAYTMSERSACTKLHKYGGEWVYDLERAAQIIPGMCPIRKGKYQIRNVLMNYNKITLQAFPFGEIRLTGNLINKDNQVISCVVALVENPIV